MRFSEEEAYAIVQTPKARKRFDDKVMPEPNSGCWLWLGASGLSGHGQFFLRAADGRRGLTGTHRVSYMLHVGKIPEGMHICHRCDNPACVNPAHLFLGTHVDNMADMRAKNRMVMPDTVGAANSQAILTEAQVLEIRASRLPLKLLAARFGVTKTCVHDARTGATWGHLPNARPTEKRRDRLANRIQDTGTRRPNASGRNAIVWKVKA